MSQADTLNMDTLDILKEAMEDEFDELVEVFLESSLELLDGMEQAQSANDVDTYTRNVHSLKSSSANLGCELLSSMAAEVEHHCKATNTFPDDAETFSALRKAFMDAKQALQNA